MEQKFKIIYIIGTGRNGSTLLDVVLGNSEKLQSTGELFNTIVAWQTNKICSCEKPVDKCPFWLKVKNLFDETFKELDYSDISKILKPFERKPVSPLNFAFHKLVRSSKYNQYESFLRQLYTTLSIVSQKPVLVDSSKNPFRGYALLNVFKENVYFIHLVRDGRGQMWSWMKAGIIPPFGINIKKNVASGNTVEENYLFVDALALFYFLADL